MEQETIVVDGSMGEGGGQIVRTALALSMVTGKPVTIEKIRMHRKKPGLQRQHLMAVMAAREVSGAEVRGASLGSTGIGFAPGRVRAGGYHFDIGSAGSITLVLQTILPPLMLADGGSRLTLKGGTHNPLAPPVDYLQKSFLPILRRMGPKVTIGLKGYGFYPAGGGLVDVTIEPVRRLERIELPARGEIRRITATALVARLPESIGTREVNVVKEGLHVDVSEVRRVAGPGPGNVVSLEIESDWLTEVVTAFGERGVPAETVAGKAVEEAAGYLATGAPVGPHLADQLLLPMALAPGGGSFRTGAPTSHAITGMEVIKRFLDVAFHVVQIDETVWEIEVRGCGTSDKESGV